MDEAARAILARYGHQEVDPDGQPWPPLSPGYAAWETSPGRA